MGGAILIAPVYIAEIAPSALRGSLVSFNQLMIVIGISASFFSNYFLLSLGENCWRWMLGVEAVPAALYLVLLFFVPESPRWLFGKGREDQALKIFTQVAGPEHAADEIRSIRQKCGGTRRRCWRQRVVQPENAVRHVDRANDCILPADHRHQRGFLLSAHHFFAYGRRHERGV